MKIEISVAEAVSVFKEIQTQAKGKNMVILPISRAKLDLPPFAKGVGKIY